MSTQQYKMVRAEVSDGGDIVKVVLEGHFGRIVFNTLSGAYRMLKRFAGRAGRTNWYEGENSWTMDGRPYGWHSEPYLADQVTVPAAIIDGFFGINMSWEGITVNPAMPSEWESAWAKIKYKGEGFRINISKGRNIRFYTTIPDTTRGPLIIITFAKKTATCSGPGLPTTSWSTECLKDQHLWCTSKIMLQIILRRAL